MEFNDVELIEEILKHKEYDLQYLLQWHHLKWVLEHLYLSGRKNECCMFMEDILRADIDFNHEHLAQPFLDISFLEILFNEMKKYKRYKNMDILTTSYKEIYELLDKETSLSTSIFSNEFISNLKYLKCLSKDEMRKNQVYQNCLSLFMDYYKENIDIRDHDKILELVFNRAIKQDNLFSVLFISDELSLYHYFKTNEFVDFNRGNITLDKIQNYNTKQYIDIKNLYNTSHFPLVMTCDSTDTIRIINHLSFYGYNLYKKMISNGFSDDIFNKIYNWNFIDESSKKLFFKIIKGNLIELYSNSKEIIRILKIFNHLYETKIPNITFHKILNFMDDLEDCLFPNNRIIKENLSKLNFVSKGEPILDKIEGIKLYNQYRLRKYTTIPSIHGKLNEITYEMVDMRSPEILSNGIGSYMFPNGTMSSSCLTPAGKASSCLKHGATNVNGRFFKITHNEKICAYSWVWRAGDVLCFDNIEITSECNKIDHFENKIWGIYKLVSRKIIEISKEHEPRPIQLVIVGKNKLDIINKPLENMKKVSDNNIPNFKPNSKEELYLDDSKDTQYILYGNANLINTQDSTYLYSYVRKPVKHYIKGDDNIDLLLNSIYFDYCIYCNQEYQYLENHYHDVYYNEDWFVGINNGQTDFYYRTYDETIIEEAKQIINTEKIGIKKPMVANNHYDKLEYFLDDKNYVYDKNLLSEYLKSIKENFIIPNNSFFHSPSNIKNFGKIIYDGAITSANVGKRLKNGESNGKYFICVAKVDTSIYFQYKQLGGFLLDRNICAFATLNSENYAPFIDFTNTSYPLRKSINIGEYQVLDKICLDRALAIMINTKNILDIGKICYIQEEKDNSLPLITVSDYSLLDSSEIKRLIKLK